MSTIIRSYYNEEIDDLYTRTLAKLEGFSETSRRLPGGSLYTQPFARHDRTGVLYRVVRSKTVAGHVVGVPHLSDGKPTEELETIYGHIVPDIAASLNC